MLRLADVQASDVVYDLGSGDGRVVIAAARDWGARGVGIEIDGKLVIYLSKGDTVHVVGAGDVIDSQYRVESITETQVTITYIPLTTRQVLPTPRK